jgi:ribonuclease HII
MGKVTVVRKKAAFALEDSHGAFVCGIDEAGRAPLAGPVSAACVFVFPETRKLKFWKEVDDSKKIPKEKRETLFDLIRSHTAFGVGMASAQEIDEINIHHATLLAMKRAFHVMKESFATVQPLMALVDGKFTPDIPCPATAIVGGDGLSKSIGAASILAKVTRDRLMAELHAEFPVYGWNRNAAYPTPEHLDAIRAHGITLHHRRSFARCRQLDLYVSD